MDTTVLPATRRTHLGTKYTRRLRQHGKLPAIIYGHGETPEPITLEAHDVKVALLHHSRLVEVDVEGDRQRHLIKAVQYDHLGTNPIHVDLVRVAMDERVHVKVGVTVKGTPAGAAEGGTLEHLLTEIEIECLVTSIPEELTVNVNDLAIGGSVTVADLRLPEGVKVLADPDEKIAICREPTVAPAEEEAEVEGEETAEVEPEVIGRAKEEEEGGEGEK